MPANIQHEIARLEARRFGSALSHDSADTRLLHRLAVMIDDPAENHQRQQQVGDRPGHDDGCALPHLLPTQRRCFFSFRHGQGRLSVGHAGPIGVAVKLDIASQRYPGQPPARAFPVGKPPKFRPDANRKHLDLDAAPAPDKKMTHLMHKDDEAHHRQKGENMDAPKAPYIIEYRHMQLLGASYLPARFQMDSQPLEDSLPNGRRPDQMVTIWLS